MKLRFLGKDSDGGQSPTLYEADEQINGKDVYIIQGWRITDPETLAQLDLPPHETVVAVPKKLMDHLPKETHGPADG